MAIDLNDFLDEFDDLTRQVRMARFQDFPQLLRRWFATFDEAPENLRARLRWVEKQHPWAEHEAEITEENRGVGPSGLSWPDNRVERLSAQLSLFREMAEEKVDAFQFSMEYFRTSSSNINDTLHQMTEHLFEQHASELRRYLVRNADNSPPDEMSRDEIPAADRIVRLDHNSQAHADADAALASVEKSIQEINSGDDPEEKERVIAQVGAARRLLMASTVRLSALTSLLGFALAWAATQFAETAAGQAAAWAIERLVDYLPELSGLF